MNAVTNTTSGAVLVALGLALAAGAAEPPKVGATPQEPAKITHDWPCHTGPEGTFADPSKVPLWEDFIRADWSRRIQPRT